MSQMGEQAYDQKLDAILDIGLDILASNLCEACYDNDFDKVKELISIGANPSAGDYDKKNSITYIKLVLVI